MPTEAIELFRLQSEIARLQGENVTLWKTINTMLAIVAVPNAAQAERGLVVAHLRSLGLVEAAGQINAGEHHAKENK